MSLLAIRTILVNDPTVAGLLGTVAGDQNMKVGPLQAILNEQVPYVILQVAGVEVFNALAGFAGLNRTEIEISAWDDEYQVAVTLAEACRAAIEAAGDFTLRGTGDEHAFQGDKAIYRHGFIVQTFD